MTSLKVGDKVAYEGVGAVVRYIGATQFAEGEWVGLQLEKPYGKNNGSVKGVSYFTCPDKYGLFVRPSVVTKVTATQMPTKKVSSTDSSRPSGSSLKHSQSRHTPQLPRTGAPSKPKSTSSTQAGNPRTDCTPAAPTSPCTNSNTDTMVQIEDQESLETTEPYGNLRKLGKLFSDPHVVLSEIDSVIAAGSDKLVEHAVYIAEALEVLSVCSSKLATALEATPASEDLKRRLRKLTTPVTVEHNSTLLNGATPPQPCHRNANVNSCESGEECGLQTKSVSPASVSENHLRPASKSDSSIPLHGAISHSVSSDTSHAPASTTSENSSTRRAHTDHTIVAAKLGEMLTKRPTKEHLMQKNIIRSPVTTTAPNPSKPGREIDMERKAKADMLAQKLLKRPSVVDLVTRKILTQTQQVSTSTSPAAVASGIAGMPAGAKAVTTETLSFHKQTKGHVYGLSMFVAKETGQLWCSSGRNIRVYDAQIGKLQHTIDGRATQIKALVPCNGQVWAAAADAKIRVFSAESGELQRTLEGHNAPIRCLLAVGNAVWSGAADGCACVWDASSGTLRKQFQCHTRGINSLTLVPAGGTEGNACIWTTSDDKTLRVVDSTSYTPLKKLRGHTDYVKSLAVVGDRAFSASEDKTVGVWDTRTFKLVRRLFSERPVKSIVAVGQQVFLGSLSGNIHVYDAATLDLVRTLSLHTYAVSQLFEYDFAVWCAFIDQTVVIYDVKKDRVRNSYKLSEEYNVEVSTSEYLRPTKPPAASAGVVSGNSANLVADEATAPSEGGDDVSNAGGEGEDSDDDMAMLVQYIERVLADNVAVEDRLPIATGSVQECIASFCDGVILCQLIDKAQPGTIDGRVLNVGKPPLSSKQILENVNLCLNGAKAIGCDITGISAKDFLEKEHRHPQRLLRFSWQLAEACLFSALSNENAAAGIRLLRSLSTDLPAGENAVAKGDLGDSALSKLAPEELLLWFVNTHVKRSTAGQSPPRTVTNFSTDVKDGRAYLRLLAGLFPEDISAAELAEIGGLIDAPESPGDNERAAQKVVALADRVGCGRFLTKSDILHGRYLLNMAFVSELFQKWSAKISREIGGKASAGTHTAAMQATAARFSRRPGSDREIRTFLAWLNTAQTETYVSDLFEDLRDGVVLLRMIDRISPSIVPWKSVIREPSTVFQRIENCTLVVKLASQLGIGPLKGIVGKDIAEGNETLTLALLWQLMRFDVFTFLSKLSYQGNAVSEATIVQWANERVASTTGERATSRIESFRDPSLSTGRFLIDLLASIRPAAINYKYVTPGETPQQCMMNAQYVINCAWKIGCSVFLLWEDIVDVKANMILLFVAAVMSYCSGN